MFEGWAADLLAASLGRFVDVQKDKLQISLWSGQGVLENVQIRGEAFEYLKLPVAIAEGSVGRLRIQIPWGRWMTGAPLVIELNDVLLRAAERQPSEWEEAAALRREQAAKQADLAAAELAKLSHRMAGQQHSSSRAQAQAPTGHPPGAAAATPAATVAGAAGPSGAAAASGAAGGAGGGGPAAAGGAAAAAASLGSQGAGASSSSTGSSTSSSSSSWGRWSVLGYLATFLLKRLQISVRNVHIMFSGHQDGAPMAVGVKLGSLSTAPDQRNPAGRLAKLFGSSVTARQTVGSQCLLPNVVRNLYVAFGLESLIYLEPAVHHAPQHVRLARHILLERCCLYWRSPRPHHGRAATATVLQGAPEDDEDYILRPFDVVLRITVGQGLAVSASGAGAAAAAAAAAGGQSHAASSASATRLEVLAGVETLQGQINKGQLQGLMQLSDDVVMWSKRSRYGRFRPPGWCTAAQVEDMRRAQAADAAAAATGHDQADDGGGSSAPERVQLQRSNSDPGMRLLLPRAGAPRPSDSGGPPAGGSESRRSTSNAGLVENSAEDAQPYGAERPRPARTGHVSASASPSGRRTQGPRPSSAARAAPPAQRTHSAGPRASAATMMASSPNLLLGLEEEAEADEEALEVVRDAPALAAVAASPICLMAAASPEPLAGSVAAVASGQGQGPEQIPPTPCRLDAVHWSHVWQFAGRAVIHDLRERRRTARAPLSLRDYLHYKHRYMHLYRRKLEHLRHPTATPAAAAQAPPPPRASTPPLGGTASGLLSPGGAAAGPAAAAAVAAVAPPLEADEVTELQRLEADLAVADILTFRQLTELRLLEEEQERAAVVAASAAASAAVSIAPSEAAGSSMYDDGSDDDDEEGYAAAGAATPAAPAGGAAPAAPPAQQPRSWLAWGLSGVSGWLYGGSSTTSSRATPHAVLSDADLGELYRLLEGTSLQGPGPSAASVAEAGSAAGLAAGMPICCQFRVLQLSLDVKAPPPAATAAASRPIGSVGVAAAASAQSLANSASSSSIVSSSFGAPSCASLLHPPLTILTLSASSSAVAVDVDGPRAAVSASIGILTAYDLCSDPGSAECILGPLHGPAAAVGPLGRHGLGTGRGSAGGLRATRSVDLRQSQSSDSLDGAGHWAMGLPSPPSSSLLSPVLRWHTGPPMLSASWQSGSRPDAQPTGARVDIQPLRLVYRQRCFAALGAVLRVDVSKSLEQHLMHSIAMLRTREKRILAKLQHLNYSLPSLALQLNLEHVDVILPAQGCSAAGDAPHVCLTLKQLALDTRNPGDRSAGGGAGGDGPFAGLDLPRLLQQRLSPSSTVLDLLALTSAAEAAATAAAAEAGDAPAASPVWGASDDSSTTHGSAPTAEPASSSSRELLLDHLEGAFLYQHLELVMDAATVSYSPCTGPGGPPPAMLLPAPLRLSACISANRLGLDTSAHSNMVRLAVAGIGGTLRSSQVSEFLTLLQKLVAPPPPPPAAPHAAPAGAAPQATTEPPGSGRPEAPGTPVPSSWAGAPGGGERAAGDRPAPMEVVEEQNGAAGSAVLDGGAEPSSSTNDRTNSSSSSRASSAAALSTGAGQDQPLVAAPAPPQAEAGAAARGPRLYVQVPGDPQPARSPLPEAAAIGPATALASSSMSSITGVGASAPEGVGTSDTETGSHVAAAQPQPDLTLPHSNLIELRLEPFELTYQLDEQQGPAAQAPAAAAATAASRQQPGSAASGLGGGPSADSARQPHQRAPVQPQRSRQHHESLPAITLGCGGINLKLLQVGLDLSVSAQLATLHLSSALGAAGRSSMPYLCVARSVRVNHMHLSYAASAARGTEASCRLEGVCLHGPPDAPGTFVLPNGPNSASVSVRYWCAPSPAAAMGAAAAGQVQAAQRAGAGCTAATATAAGAALPDGLAACGGSGVEVHIREVAVGVGLLTALSSAAQAGTAMDPGHKQQQRQQQQQPATAAAGAAESPEPPAAAGSPSEGPAQLPPPFHLAVHVQDCAVLSVARSRTPAAEALGTAQLACHAALNVASCKLQVGQPRSPAPAPAAAAAAEAAAAASTDCEPTPDHPPGGPHPEERLRGPGVQRQAQEAAAFSVLELRDLALLLADSWDSAYLSPVLLLPQLDVTLLPGAPAAPPAAPPQGPALRAPARFASYAVRVPCVQLSAQPQQAGSVCALLDALSAGPVPAADPAAQPQPQPHGQALVRNQEAALNNARAASAASAASAAQPPEAAPVARLLATLPALYIQADVGELHATLGSDGTNDEATAVAWSGLALSYSRAGGSEADATASLAWRSLCVTSAGGHPEPGPFPAAAGAERLALLGSSREVHAGSLLVLQALKAQHAQRQPAVTPYATAAVPIQGAYGTYGPAARSGALMSRAGTSGLGDGSSPSGFWSALNGSFGPSEGIGLPTPVGAIAAAATVTGGGRASAPGGGSPFAANVLSVGPAGLSTLMPAGASVPGTAALAPAERATSGRPIATIPRGASQQMLTDGLDEFYSVEGGSSVADDVADLAPAAAVEPDADGPQAYLVGGATYAFSEASGSVAAASAAAPPSASHLPGHLYSARIAALVAARRAATAGRRATLLLAAGAQLPRTCEDDDEDRATVLTVRLHASYGPAPLVHLYHGAYSTSSSGSCSSSSAGQSPTAAATAAGGFSVVPTGNSSGGWQPQAGDTTPAPAPPHSPLVASSSSSMDPTGSMQQPRCASPGVAPEHTLPLRPHLELGLTGLHVLASATEWQQAQKSLAACQTHWETAAAGHRRSQAAAVAPAAPRRGSTAAAGASSGATDAPATAGGSSAAWLLRALQDVPVTARFTLDGISASVYTASPVEPVASAAPGGARRASTHSGPDHENGGWPGMTSTCLQVEWQLGMALEAAPSGALERVTVMVPEVCLAAGDVALARCDPWVGGWLCKADPQRLVLAEGLSCAALPQWVQPADSRTDAADADPWVSSGPGAALSSHPVHNIGGAMDDEAGLPPSQRVSETAHHHHHHQHAHRHTAVQVHALMDVRMQHLSLYAARTTLLHLASLLQAIKEHFSHLRAQQRPSSPVHDSDDDSDGEGGLLDGLDERLAYMSPGPGPGLLLAGAGVAPAPFLTSRGGVLPHYPLPAPGGGAGYGLGPLGHMGLPRGTSEPSVARSRSYTDVYGYGAFQLPPGGRTRQGGGCGTAPAPWHGVLPAWLPLACLTVHVTKTAMLLSTDLQGHSVPLFEVAVTPLDLQLRVGAAAASSGANATAPHSVGPSGLQHRQPAPSAPIAAAARHPQVPTAATPFGSLTSAASRFPAAAHVHVPSPGPSSAAPGASAAAAPPRVASSSSTAAAPAALLDVASLQVVLDLRLLVDVFNLEKLGWEPVVEPWAVQTLYTCQLPDRQQPTRQPHHALSATTHSLLDVTIAPGLMPAVVAAGVLASELTAAWSWHAHTADGAAAPEPAASHVPATRISRREAGAHQPADPVHGLLHVHLHGSGSAAAAVPMQGPNPSLRKGGQQRWAAAGHHTQHSAPLGAPPSGDHRRQHDSAAAAPAAAAAGVPLGLPRFWLHNLLGSAIQYHLTNVPQNASREPPRRSAGDGAARKLAAHATNLPLICVDAHACQLSGRHVSTHASLSTDTIPRATQPAWLHDASAAAAAAAPAAASQQRRRRLSSSSSFGAVGGSHADFGEAAISGDTLLYLQLPDRAGQGPLVTVGPVRCDAQPGARIVAPISVSGLGPAAGAAAAGASAGRAGSMVGGAALPAAAAAAAAPPLSIVCEVKRHHHFSRCAVVRTNVRVANETGLDLAIGAHEPGGPVATHTAGPAAAAAMAAAGVPGIAAGGVLGRFAAAAAAAAGGAAPSGIAAGAGTKPVIALQRLAAGSSMWLPALLLQQRGPVMLAFWAAQPHVAHAAASTHAAAAATEAPWSSPLNLSGMMQLAMWQLTAPTDAVAPTGACVSEHLQFPLRHASEAYGRRTTSAAPASAGTCVVLAALSLDAGRGEWLLRLMAPAVLRNLLPVPVQVLLTPCAPVPDQPGVAPAPPAAAAAAAAVSVATDIELRHQIQEASELLVHQLPAQRLATLQFRPQGYHWSGSVSLRPQDPDAEPLHPGLWGPEAMEASSGRSDPWVDPQDAPGMELVSEALAPVRSGIPGFERLALVVRSWRHRPTGQLHVELSCPVWIYNCVGVPVAVRPTASLFAWPHEPGLPETPAAAWVPPCLSSNGVPAMAGASGPCSSQLAALQAATTMPGVRAPAGSGSSSCGGAAPPTVGSSSSVRSGRSADGHPPPSSERSVVSGHGGPYGASGRGPYGSSGLLATLAQPVANPLGRHPSQVQLPGTLEGQPQHSSATNLPYSGRTASPDMRGASSAPGLQRQQSSAAQLGGAMQDPNALMSPRAGPAATGAPASPQPHLHQRTVPDPLYALQYQAPAAGGASIPSPRAAAAAVASSDAAAAASAQPQQWAHGNPISPHRAPWSPAGAASPAPPGAASRGGTSGARPSEASLRGGSAWPAAGAAGAGGGTGPGGATGAGATYGADGPVRHNQLVQPCMYGDVPVGAGQVELCVWPGGGGKWSAPLWPEESGSPQQVTLPCPLPDGDGGTAPYGSAGGGRVTAGWGPGGGGSGGGGRPGEAEGQPALQMVVCASRVAGVPRSVALHLLPRYVVHNSLAVAIQVRQQGTSYQRSLAPGERWAVHWADVRLPPKLQLRIQETGWSWSGGVALDAVDPGDLFVKVRHNNSGETQLVRMDISITGSGVLLASLSHHHSDFAPYRVDNCTGELLHIQQVGSLDQEDIVRPYSCLPWAWDEHTAPQRVLVSLQGRRKLGEFELEEVGQAVEATVMPSRGTGRQRKRLLITITADGPTRVLKVVDLSVHPYPYPTDPRAAATAHNPAAGGHGGHGGGASVHLNASAAGHADHGHHGHHGPYAGAGGSTARGRHGAAAAAASSSGEGWLVELSASVAGVAVSLVSERAEVMYALVQGVRGQLSVSTAKVSASLSLQHLRVDNCLDGAVFPVMVCSPVGRTMFNTATMLHQPPQQQQKQQPQAHPNPYSRQQQPDAEIAAGDAGRAAGGGADGGGEQQHAPLLGAAAADAAGALARAALGGHSSSMDLLQQHDHRQQHDPHAMMMHRAGSSAMAMALAVTPFATPQPAREAAGRGGGRSRRSSRVQAAPPPALTCSITLWRNRPGGDVLCVQHVSVTPAPLAVNIEELHLRQLAEAAAAFARRASQEAPAALAADGGSVTRGPAGGPGGRSMLPAGAQLVRTPGGQWGGYMADMAVLLPAGMSGATTRTGGSASDSRARPRGAERSGGGAAGGSCAALSAGMANSARGDAVAPGGGGGGSRAPAGAAAGSVAGSVAAATDSARIKRIYIEDLHIGEIMVSASFAPAPLLAAAPSPATANAAAGDSADAFGDSASAAAADAGGGGGMASSLVRLLVSLAHLEGAWVTLRAMDLRYPLLRQEALVQVVARHYMSAALGELIKVVGSLDIFGDVARLLQGFGLGVWHLISMPAKGAIRGGITTFAAGLLYGIGSAIRTTTFATSNSIAKTTRRARTALTALVPEPVQQAFQAPAAAGPPASAGTAGGSVAPYGRAGQVRTVYGVPVVGHGNRDLLQSSWEGYAGIVQRLGLKASRLDLVGAARELAMGAIGTVALPSMLVLQLVEAAATSVRAVVAPHSRSGGLYGPVRPRVPRYVDPGLPLQPYSWLESYCRLLQKDVWGGAFGQEDFVGGIKVCGGALALVTQRHLLLIRPRQANDSKGAEVALVVPMEGVVLSQQQGGGGHAVSIAHLYVNEQLLPLVRPPPPPPPLAPAAALGGHGGAAAAAGDAGSSSGGGGASAEQSLTAAGAAHSVPGSAANRRLVSVQRSGSSTSIGGGGGSRSGSNANLSRSPTSSAASHHHHNQPQHSGRSASQHQYADAGDDDEDASADAAARLQPPPWLCVTVLELQSDEDAGRLVALLEGVRESHDQQRLRVHSCRMIGF